MQAAQPEITIWDHGELGDVRQLMGELGVDFDQGEAREADPLPSHLLISSGSSSVHALKRIKQGHRSHHFLHLIIVEGASRALTNVLEREGCDMVVTAPIHPVALRLLVQRALFSGENKRLVPRVAIGQPVKVQAGARPRDAILAELSVRGCGVITDRELSVGSRLSLVLPAKLTGGSKIELEGTVVGVKSEGGEHFLGVVFRNHDKSKAVAINKIMQHYAVGPTGQLESEPGTPLDGAPTNVAPAAAAQPDAASDERRAEPRALYPQPVLARGSGRIHSLIGRDLSISGMRVSHHDGLCIGDRLQLAIYGGRGRNPVVVSAEVVRESPSSELGLVFDPPPSRSATEQLRAIIETLPAVGGSGPPSGTVVSEVLSTS